MKIAVIGAGIFGCVIALKLREKFKLAEIIIFEENNSIISGASYCNQYRLHRGYHYPRSNETVSQVLNSVLEFENEFRDCVYDFGFRRYYCIANEGSLINSDQYLRFLDENKLWYQIQRDKTLPVNYDKIDLTLKVKENSYSVIDLKSILTERLLKSKINVNLNTRFTKVDIQKYDLVINSTYSQINELLPEDVQMDYQYELVEKCVIYTPQKLKFTSIVVMDGEFCCIDPDSSVTSVLGHVKTAIHDRQIGRGYLIPEGYENILNRGQLLTTISRSNEIINSCSEYFPDLDQGQYYKSMFTIRTVLPNREHDDFRPTQILKHSDRLYSIFGGKVGTSVSIANQLIKEL